MREQDAQIQAELSGRLEELNRLYNETQPKLAGAADKRNHMRAQQVCGGVWLSLRTPHFQHVPFARHQERIAQMQRAVPMTAADTAFAYQQQYPTHQPFMQQAMHGMQHIASWPEDKYIWSRWTGPG